jgi:hypothetical protein
MSEYQPFEIEMNLEEVEAWSGESRPLLPQGTYRVEVANIKQEAKYIAFEFRVIEGEQTGGVAYNNYMIGTKPGQARLKQVMLACGAALTRFSSDEIIGAKLFVDVVHTLGKEKVNELGEPLPAKTFANVQNERAQLADGEGGQDAGATDATPDPEPPPITRQQPTPAAAGPAASASSNGKATTTRSRRA